MISLVSWLVTLFGKSSDWLASKPDWQQNVIVSLIAAALIGGAIGLWRLVLWIIRRVKARKAPPLIVGRIDDAMAGKVDDRLQMLMVASIKNNAGASNSFERFSLVAKSLTGELVEGRPLSLPPGRWEITGEHGSYVVDPADSLVRKAIDPVPLFVRGYLLFDFPPAAESVLKAPGTVLELSFFDVGGNRYVASDDVTGAGTPGFTQFDYPGIKQQPMASHEATKDTIVSQSNNATSPALREKPTMASLFKSDFPHLLKVGNELSMQRHDGKNNTTTKIQANLYIDFDGQSEFVGFHIPEGLDSQYDLAVSLADYVTIPLGFTKDVKAWSGYIGGQRTSTDDLRFTGRVYIYHEDYFSPRQIADLIDIYHNKGFSLELRGLDYLGLKMLDK